MFNGITKWAVFCYGVALIVLGILGYVLAKSQPSLIAGCLSGLAMLFCSYAMFKDKKGGSYTAIGLTILLTAIFSYRYSVTKFHFPAIMAVLSGAMLIFLLLQLASLKKSD